MHKKKDENEIILENDPELKGQSSDSLDDSVVAEEHATETIKKLREKLKAVEAEKTEYLTGWQRAKADMINSRKREEAERAEFVKYANERLIDGLVPVLESFDMAMGNKEAWEKADKNWRTGVEYIYSQLRKALSESGVEEIDPLGQKFDHALHEAASYEPVDDQKKDHIVLGVIQKGFTLNGKLIKPAKVRVGEYKK